MTSMAVDSVSVLGTLTMQEIYNDDVPFLTTRPSKSQILAFQAFYKQMANDFGIDLRDLKMAGFFWKDVKQIFYPHLAVGHLMRIYTAGPFDYDKIVLPSMTDYDMMEKPILKRKRTAETDEEEEEIAKQMRDTHL